jgi:hypothetical protein
MLEDVSIKTLINQLFHEKQKVQTLAQFGEQEEYMGCIFMLGLSINTTSSLSHGMISLGIQLKIIVVHNTHFCLHDKISKHSLELVAKKL